MLNGENVNVMLEYCIQSYFKGSNTFGTMKICIRQGSFELMGVNHSTRTGGIIGISLLSVSHIKVHCGFSLELPH